MNDDIETIRKAVKALATTVDEDELEPAQHAADAALDRLEIALRGGRAKAIEQRDAAMAEVERLRAENARLRAQDDKAWIAWHKRKHDNKGER
jgi:hypothetical protein